MRALIAVLMILASALPALAYGNQMDEFTRGKDAFVRSLFLPGLGQIEQGRPGAGAAWAGGTVLVAVATFKAHVDYHSAAMDHENAGESYARALYEGDTDTAWHYFQQLDGLKAEADDRYDTRRAWTYGLAAVWAANLLDVWWHGRGGDERVAFIPLTGAGGGGLAVRVCF